MTLVSGRKDFSLVFVASYFVFCGLDSGAVITFVPLLPVT